MRLRSTEATKNSPITLPDKRVMGLYYVPIRIPNLAMIDRVLSQFRSGNGHARIRALSAAPRGLGCGTPLPLGVAMQPHQVPPTPL